MLLQLSVKINSWRINYSKMFNQIEFEYLNNIKSCTFRNASYVILIIISCAFSTRAQPLLTYKTLKIHLQLLQLSDKNKTSSNITVQQITGSPVSSTEGHKKSSHL